MDENCSGAGEALTHNVRPLLNEIRYALERLNEDGPAGDLLRGVVGTMTRVVPMLPDPLLKRMEAMNFSLGRKVLSMELGDNPATWGFKAIA